MKCPIDGSTLSITVRDEVEIDYCPECRGVWLDRGELDKIIDRAATSLAANPAPPAPPAPPREATRHDRERYDERRYDDRRHYDDRRYDSRSDDHGRYGTTKKRKRKSFLEDLFEFD